MHVARGCDFSSEHLLMMGGIEVYKPTKGAYFCFLLLDSRCYRKKIVYVAQLGRVVMLGKKDGDLKSTLLYYFDGRTCHVFRKSQYTFYETFASMSNRSIPKPCLRSSSDGDVCIKILKSLLKVSLTFSREWIRDILSIHSLVNCGFPSSSPLP